MRAAWVLVQLPGSDPEVISLEEYLDREDRPEVFAVTRDLQVMCDLHARYVGLVRRTRLTSEQFEKANRRLLELIERSDKAAKDTPPVLELEEVL